ncbi:hypothetical protein ACGFJ7_21770 [Actinoplanes sp. NPDC048988]|uniref:5-methylcytosine restriction system specificity protein McrC n=1 Tax=Actinoplanes sp. NPDC048988 TaxID=3363901 RepID=UPI00370FF1EC
MLELIEYATTTADLTAAEAGELAQMARGSRHGERPRVIERLAPTMVPGRYEIQPGPYVGRFVLGSGRVVDLGCRFPFHDLANLLLYGRRPLLLEETAAPGLGGHSLMDLIALAFVRQAELIAGQGLVKAYQRQSFSRPPYPGVPMPAVHLKRHAGRPDRLATVANRLTADVPANRLVATALRRLGTLPLQDESVTARLRGLVPVFRGIGDTSGPLPEHAAPARYRGTLDLARLILDDRTTLPTGAGVSGVSVLFTMTRIWENYVEQWLTDRSPGSVVSPQHRIPLTDDGPGPTARADFVVLEKGRPTGVYDAKYRPWRQSPSTDEIYQLFTYAHRLGTKYAALVYPSADDRRATTTISGITIDTWGVPLRPAFEQAGGHPR